jgi:hypothetical protein
MKGSELSKAYFEERLLPLIRRFDPAIELQMAAGVFGMGSDASGLDDELSREHHWGPRCNILLSDSLEARCAPLEAYLQRNGPKKYRGFAVYHLKYNRCGVTVETVSQYFRDMVGLPEAPEELSDWFSMTEADLFHITGGQVFVDHPGEYSHRVQGFAYYPEPLWRKKLADWCVFLVGHGVYNINRARLRQDRAAATVYFGVTVKRLLEMGHLLNRTYAPYNKWLRRNFSRLPLVSAELLPRLDHALETSSWEERCLDLIGCAVVINDELQRQGLTQRYYPASGSPHIAEAWFYFLYDAAAELYRSVPERLVFGRFNEVEKWEEVVKQVILAPDWKEGFHETTPNDEV